MTDDTIIVASGGAEPGDLHLLADVRAVDDGIIAYLAAPRVLSFSDDQLDLLFALAEPMPVEARAGFLRAVAAALTCRGDV